MYTVIAYKEAFQENAVIRIYDDSTEKSFLVKEDANAYSSYLDSNNVARGLNSGVDLYEKYVYTSGELDIDELKKSDALAKLTEEEKVLLGVH